MNKRLISIDDFSRPQIESLFRLSAQVKKNQKKYNQALKGLMFGLIFEKPSTRTWISFDSGIFSLGGGTIYLGPEDIKLGKREETRDVARVLNRYLAGVVLRTFSHETITEFEKYFEGAIINGLSDFEHPCQALADFFTLYEKMPKGKRPVLAFVGDGNNVLHSLLLLGAKLGGTVKFATPKKFVPSRKVVEKARKLAAKAGGEIVGTQDPVEAVRGADVIYTDVWVSMGEEAKRSEKMKEFQGYQVNDGLVKKAKPGVFVMHCLPAHRGEEITDSVMESKHSIVFDQAENRLHIQKAILLHLCGKGGKS